MSFITDSSTIASDWPLASADRFFFGSPCAGSSGTNDLGVIMKMCILQAIVEAMGFGYR